MPDRARATRWLCAGTPNDFLWTQFTSSFPTEKADQCEIQERGTAQKFQSLWESPGSHIIPEDMMM